MVENWKNKILSELGPPWFILTQGGEVLDVSHRPGALLWCLVEADSDFKVAVGVVNEFGNKEIAGICAEYLHGNDTVWYLTSPMDGVRRLVGKTGTPMECIQQRLSTLFKQGRLTNPIYLDYVLLQC